MIVGQADVAVVGSGIVGLAIAYEAARRGLKVVLFERTNPAVGASVRNFGLIWPVGQPSGSLFERALESRSTWLSISREVGFWCSENGSLHLAYHEDELAVLEEYAEMVPEARVYGRLLDPVQVAARSRIARMDGLKGAYWSSTELNVDPRQAVRVIPGWLHSAFGVELHFGTPVTRIQMPEVVTPIGSWRVGRVFVCSGQDFESLYPAEFAATGITRCKLQMMRSSPQPHGRELGPSLCAGLTLLHYRSFAECPSLPMLRQRIERDLPFHVEHRIHVLLSQTSLGELTIGDHHAIGDTVDPFDREDIQQAILSYLRTFADLPSLEIAERWHGVYPLIPGKSEVVLVPEPGVTLVNALGGAGMTLSFGLARTLLDS